MRKKTIGITGPRAWSPDCSRLELPMKSPGENIYRPAIGDRVNVDTKDIVRQY